MGRVWMTRVCMVALAWPVAASSATAVLPPGAVLAQPERWAATEVITRRVAARVLDALNRGDVDAALAQLHAQSDAMVAEAVAAQVIDTLQAQDSPSAATEQWLAVMEREPVRVFQRHEETAANWFQPVFDVPGRAASARLLFANAARRDQLLAKLELDPRAASEAKDAAILAAAIEKLSRAALQALRDAALHRDLDLPSVAWTTLARQLPDQALLDAALRRADALDALPLLQDLSTLVTPTQALDCLKHAAQQPALTSAAVLGMGRLVPQLPAAETELAAYLGDAASGASAAAALAQLAVPDRLKRIEGWIARAERPAQVNDLALALRLEGSAAARERLRALAQDPRLDASLRAELQR